VYARTCLGVNKRYDSRPVLGDVHGPAFGQTLPQSGPARNKRPLSGLQYTSLILQLRAYFSPSRSGLIKDMTPVKKLTIPEFKRIMDSNMDMVYKCFSSKLPGLDITIFLKTYRVFLYRGIATKVPQHHIPISN
jgi:hypothetical protein